MVNERHTCNKRVYFADEKNKISNNKGVSNAFCASSSLLSQAKWFESQLTLISLYVSWLLHCIYITSKYFIFIYGIRHKKWHRKYQERFQIWVRLSESNKKHRGSNQEKTYRYLQALSTMRLAQMAGFAHTIPVFIGKRNVFSSLASDMWKRINSATWFLKFNGCIYGRILEVTGLGSKTLNFLNLDYVFKNSRCI